MGKKKMEFSEENNRKRFFPMKEVDTSKFSWEFIIHCGEGIDNPIDYTERNYAVIFWVRPGREHHTKVVKGSPNPIWKQGFRLILNPAEEFGFLNMDVVRVQSGADPGTSTGLILVGRVRIPTPRKPCMMSRRYGLVRPEGLGHKAEGHLYVSTIYEN